MAIISVLATFDDAAVLRNLFKTLPNNLAAKHLAAAVRKAIKPAIARLKQITPHGPTGNLRNAINSIVKPYPVNGTAVGMVGFNRAGAGPRASAAGGSVRVGSDRAFHQGWLEFGTKPRYVYTQGSKPFLRTSKLGKVHTVKGQGGFIASSFRRLGPFQIVAPGNPVQTDPPYPHAFFRKSSQPIVIRGLVASQPPIKTALTDTQNQMATILAEALGVGFDNAVKEFNYKSNGSASSGNI